MYSSCSIKFLSVSVCCVVLLPFLTWFAAATNATVISASIAVGSNINAILFANAAAVIAAIAELLLLLWALLLPLPLLSCGGLLQDIYCCQYRICQHHCYCYQGCCHCWAAIITACHRYLCATNIVVKTDISHQCCIFLFHFALAMTMVMMMVKATATATATAMAMARIYFCLLYDSNETIAVIIYFSFYI